MTPPTRIIRRSVAAGLALSVATLGLAACSSDETEPAADTTPAAPTAEAGGALLLRQRRAERTAYDAARRAFLAPRGNAPTSFVCR